jgi:hypothetical protein
MSSDKADAPAAGDERIHLVTIDWSRGKWSGMAGKYSREHLWHFAGKLSLKVTDALAPMAYRDTATGSAEVLGGDGRERRQVQLPATILEPERGDLHAFYA